MGSRTVCLVRLIEVLLYPVCKPMACLLDKALGEDIGTIRTVSELSKLLDIHVKHGAVDTEACSILTGALNYGTVTVGGIHSHGSYNKREQASKQPPLIVYTHGCREQVSQIMTPMSEAFCLRVDERLDYKTCSHIYKSGFSRVPVIGKDTDDILGLILTKDLILLVRRVCLHFCGRWTTHTHTRLHTHTHTYIYTQDPQDATPVRNVLTMFGRAMECLWPDTDLPSALRLFKAGKAHMALVRDVCTTVRRDETKKGRAGRGVVVRAFFPFTL